MSLSFVGQTLVNFAVGVTACIAFRPKRGLDNLYALMGVGLVALSIPAYEWVGGLIEDSLKEKISA